MIRFAAIFIVLFAVTHAQEDDDEQFVTEQFNSCIEKCHASLSWPFVFSAERKLQIPEPSSRPSSITQPQPELVADPIIVAPVKTPDPDRPENTPKPSPSLVPDPCFDICAPSDYFCYCRRSKCLPNGMCICKKYVCKRDVHHEGDKPQVRNLISHLNN